TPQAVLRRKTTPATATEITRMPPHQASACQGLLPTGAPSSRPRSVSMTGVTGWWLAKPCSHDGIVSIGTNALLGYGRNAAKKVNPAAASGLFAIRPMVAAS